MQTCAVPWNPPFNNSWNCRKSLRKKATSRFQFGFFRPEYSGFSLDFGPGRTEICRSIFEKPVDCRTSLHLYTYIGNSEKEQKNSKSPIPLGWPHFIGKCMSFHFPRVFPLVSYRYVQYTQTESIRLRHFTIRLDSHVTSQLDSHGVASRKSTSGMTNRQQEKRFVSIRLNRLESTTFSTTLYNPPEVKIREITIHLPRSSTLVGCIGQPSLPVSLA